MAVFRPLVLVSGLIKFLSASDVLSPDVLAPATTSAAGTLSAADKIRLNSLNVPTTLINGKITESHSSNAATFALKTLAGTDPSSTDPVLVIFPDGTARSVTAAVSVTLSSGSSVGMSENYAFRLWFVLFDDGGTIRLGVRNCTDATGTRGFGGNGVGSSTAEGGAGAADSAGVTYTGTAVTAKPFVIVAKAEYDSGLSAAGTWNASPTRIPLHGPGMKNPGDVVQIISATNSIQDGTTSSTYVVSSLTVSITPTSPANPIVVHAFGSTQETGAGTDAHFRLSRGNTNNTNIIGNVATTYANEDAMAATAVMEAFDRPNTGSAQIYAVQLKRNGGGGTAYFGHTAGNFMSAAEIMG